MCIARVKRVYLKIPGIYECRCRIVLRTCRCARWIKHSPHRAEKCRRRAVTAKAPRKAEKARHSYKFDTHLSILTTMSDSSSLASVVHVTFRTWEKVSDEHLLALFHRRFWAKNMEDEEEEWQKTQPQIEGQPEDEDGDRYEGKGRAIDEDDNEAMEEDELEGEATDEDEDGIPGCYPFR
jgi:hypothetical protein